jgi:hypothetical protein
MKIKQLFIPLTLLALACLMFSIFDANSAPLPEDFPAPTPPGEIRVKQYPAYRAATYKIRGNLANAANNAFYPLYQHISSNEISMTAPVETQYPLESVEGKDFGEAEVSFIYSSPLVYPREVASNITVKDVEAMLAVSLGLRGAYNYESYQEGLRKLLIWLQENPDYQSAGNPRRFFYDGPYIPDALKRSEIVIPVKFIKKF